MTCYILEDEPLAIENLKDYVSEWNHLELIGFSRNPVEGIREINQLNPDILFLDIHMPRLSGFEVLDHLDRKPLVVFTTAYSKYALEGYDFEPVDYLLKPISLSRFIQTVKRLEKRIAPNRNTTPEVILIPDGKKQHRVEKAKLFFIKSDRDYLEYHHQDGVIVSLGTLKKEETRLKNNGFIRVHNSYIINQSHIKQFSSTCVQLTTVRIPLGRTYKNTILNQIQGYHPASKNSNR